VFAATQALPGNAASVLRGTRSTPAEIKLVTVQLGLNHPLVVQYGHWLRDMFTSRLGGTSLSSGTSVSSIVVPRLVNSGILMAIVAVVSTLIAFTLGTVAALRRDSAIDAAIDTVALALTSLPEFVVAIALVMLLCTNVFHLLPAVSVTTAGQIVWTHWLDLLLPALTLTILCVPYIYRMVRATVSEALESDYAEMATLKGLRRRRVVLVHALPNALPAIVQVVALNLLYLASGVVIVETVFNYPGVGEGLVTAINARDVPTIQTLVLLLATLYVVVNITADAVALATSPRRRVLMASEAR
jgi:peptide/nickel transport system permease protein